MRLTRALGLTLAVGLALPVVGHAAIYASQASGDWSTAGTWMGMDITTPGPGDTVTIREGNVVTLTADSQADSVTIQPGAELRLAGHDLSVDSTLAINQAIANPGAITSASGTPTIAVNKTLELADASISGANVVVNPAASGGVTLSGKASISGTLTINGPGTVTFRPRVIDATNAMLSVGDFFPLGAITGELDWSFLRPPNTAADPAPGSQVKLLAATGTLHGFTVPGGAEYTIGASATSVMATWGQGTPAQPPANSAKPTISVSDTTMVPGTVLTCDAGTWSESPTYSYSWQRNGSAIVGASSATFTVGFGDIATDLTCTVTATNSAGTAQATSAGRRVEAPPVGLTVTPNPAYVGEKVTVRATAKVGEPASLSPRCFEGVACDPGADHVIPRAAGTTKVGAQVSMKYPGHPATVNVNALPTTLTVSPLPDASSVFAKHKGTAWRTTGTVSPLGVYSLPLAAIPGWTPDCTTLTPTGKAINTPVGKVGCTPTSLTLLPDFRLPFATGRDSVWKSTLTLRHDGGSATIAAPIEIRISGGKKLEAQLETPEERGDVPAPKLSSDGRITCPAGSTPTDHTTVTETSKGVLTSIQGPQGPKVQLGLTLLHPALTLATAGLTNSGPGRPATNSTVNPVSVSPKAASSMMQSSLNYLSEHHKRFPLTSKLSVSAATCRQPETGAATTNSVISVGATALVGDTTNTPKYTKILVEAILKAPSPALATGTATIARTAGAGAKAPRVPVAIVVYDRVGTGAAARVKGVAMYTGMLTKRTTTLKIPKRLALGKKTIRLSRNAGVGVFMLYRKGTTYYPAIGTYLR